MNKKIVIFGAGKIGRSFIGQLFGRSGYEVVFVDIAPNIIDALNQRRQYKVIIKADRDEVLTIKNVRGILASDKNKVVDEILSADILAVSVGKQGLSKVIPVLAKGIE